MLAVPIEELEALLERRPDLLGQLMLALSKLMIDAQSITLARPLGDLRN